MGYWKTPKEMGLNEDQITEIVDRLYKEATKDLTNTCPDCGVVGGANHQHGCDVARCKSCGGQVLSCDCKDPGEDKWTGLWPGVKECYEERLIAFGGGSWFFDLNTLAMQRK